MPRSESKKIGMDFEKTIKDIIKPYFDKFAQTTYNIYDFIGALGNYDYIIEAKVATHNGKSDRVYISILRKNAWFIHRLAKNPFIIPILIVKTEDGVKVITGLKIWNFLSRGKVNRATVNIRGWLEYAIPLEKWLAKLRGIRKKLEARKKEKK